MAKPLAALVALSMIGAACSTGSGASATTVVAATTTPATTVATMATTTTEAPPPIAVVSTTTTSTLPPSTTTTGAPPATLPPAAAWFGFLAEGDCFDDTLTSDGDFDFSVPPTVVSCDQPHDNEVTAIASVARQVDPYPGADAVAAVAERECDLATSEFLGRPLPETELLRFDVFPDETDWEVGVRVVVCSVYGDEMLVGTAASGSLTAPATTLAMLTRFDGVFDLYLFDGGDGSPTINLTNDALEERLTPASWFADGSGVAYAALDEGESNLRLAATDGSGTTELYGQPSSDDGADVSPDGRVIAFSSERAGTEPDIYLLDIETGSTTRLTDDPESDTSPDWSPDGSQILFRSRRDGNSEVYVMNADGVRPDPAHRGTGIRRRSDLVARRNQDRVHERPGRQLRHLRDECRRFEPRRSDVTPGRR